MHTLQYRPLDEGNDEIRLITILPENKKANQVHCSLEKVSLTQLTPEYRDFLSTVNTSKESKRQIHAKWKRHKSSSDGGSVSESDVLTDSIPASSFYRYQWGDYATLSYVWGDPTNTSQIVLNNQTVMVTRNLEIALRMLRSKGQFETGYKLWIDALSINQEDLDERARQIGRMQNIYRDAWSVVAWLGEEKHESDKAISLIRALSNSSKDRTSSSLHEKLTNDPDCLGAGSWLALHEFMKRIYWTRLWIIQEVVLGSSAVSIRCGSSSIDWSSFCAGIQVLFDHLWNIKDDLLTRDMERRGTDEDSRWSTVSLHLVRQDLHILSHIEEHGGDRLSFGRLLDVANAANATDVRDKIYGLVGMMDPVIAERLVPDYRKDPSQIFSDVTRAFIDQYQNLEPLREGNPWGSTGTPSWAADWTWRGRMRYARPDVILWGPFWDRTDPEECIKQAAPPFEASGKSTARFSFSESGQELTCRGFLVDTVDGLSAIEHGYFSWFEPSISQPHHRKSVYGDFLSTARALFCALLIDRVGNSERVSDRHVAILNLPSTFKAAEPQLKRLGFNWLASQEGYYFRLELWRLANRDFWIGDRRLAEYFTEQIPSNALEYDYTEAYSAFDRTCQGRRFLTTSKGYIGWGPDNIYGTLEEQLRPGDQIAVIFGCSTPIVIRPSGKRFLVLGQAYIQGLMDGEAMAFLENGSCTVRDFTFC